jgi:hypothetical protein
LKIFKFQFLSNAETTLHPSPPKKRKTSPQKEKFETLVDAKKKNKIK